MLRKSTLGALSLLTIAGSLGLHVGCGSTEDETGSGQQHSETIGEVGLDLRLPDGSEVNEVGYVITRSGLTPRTGTIPVTPDGHARLQVGNLPAGAGYNIVLKAERGTLPACEGSATFIIIAGQTTNVGVALQCGNLGRNGNAAIDGTFNYCPSTPTITATPSTVPTGTPINIGAEALDEDPVTYAWTAPSGTFAAAGQASTTFTCSVPGTVKLTVTVADSQGCTGVVGSVDVTCTEVATFSSKEAYVVPVATGVVTKAILTVGDSPSRKADGSPYRMVGIPDGLGAFDNNDGTFTLLSNQELGNGVGIARAHGGKGAFVSKWTIRKSDLGVMGGSDLIQTVNLWNTTTSAYAATPNFAFARFCSADLPAKTGLYDATSGLGYDGRIFFDGEENGNPGRAMAHVLDGNSYELPRLGHASWENIVLSPFAQTKTVSVGLDDSTPGQVYVYVGTKTNSGSPIDKAGLTNGTLYGVTVAGNATEPAAGIPTAAFTLSSLGDTTNVSGDTIETQSTTLGVTRFNRPEDGTWDPAHPNDFYFVTTNAIAAPSRLWRLRFQDIAQPELGGTLDMLLDGTEGQVMLDNIGIDARGHIMLVEDPGNNARIAQVWRYTIATDTLVNVAQHNPALFTSGAAAFITQDEEATGIIDATDLLGAGWWLSADQIHLVSSDAELVEGGQYIAIYDPGTL
jgi:hypothetical protein